MGSDELELQKDCTLFGLQIDQHLLLDKQLNNILSSCYGKLTILKKLKHFTDFHFRKRLAESLIMSKIDYNDSIYSLTQTQIKKLQRLQLSACSFVCNKYVSINDLIKIKWLPLKERRSFNLLKLVYKAINFDSWPTSCPLIVKKYSRVLRSSSNLSLVASKVKGNFQDDACYQFNDLPMNIRKERSYHKYCSQVKNYLLTKAYSRLVDANQFSLFYHL